MVSVKIKIAAVAIFVVLVIGYNAMTILFLQSDEYKALQEQREADALKYGKHTPLPFAPVSSPAVITPQTARPTASPPGMPWEVTPTPVPTVAPTTKPMATPKPYPTDTLPFPSPTVRPRSPNRNRSA